jgi:cell division topological specificity factor
MSIFDWGGKHKSTRELAKERLQLVLVYDRAHLDPGIVDSLKEDLVNTISKYPNFDIKNLYIDFSQKDDQVVLRIDIPIKI